MRLLLLCLLLTSCSTKEIQQYKKKEELKDCITDYVKLGIPIKEAYDVCLRL